MPGEQERDRDLADRDRDKDRGNSSANHTNSSGSSSGGSGSNHTRGQAGGGDQCHNGESLGRSPYIRQSADRDWPWMGYTTKHFRSFAQEFPPTLDVGADEVIL